MIYRRPLLAVASVALSLSLHCVALAQGSPEAPVKALLFLSPIFGDNMVLQRGKPNSVWGWSEPGDQIRIEIAGKHAEGVAGIDRRWQVKIQLPTAGGPFTLTIKGHQTVELHNVPVGDVWLCGGQSNMQVGLRSVNHGEEEVKGANYPQVRFFSVAPNPAYRRTELVEGTWKILSPDTAASVSAVAYYFARKVQKEIHVPIGLVVDALGGTPAEAWTSAEALRPLNDFDIPPADLEKMTAAGAPEYGNYIMHWYDQYDVGLKGNWAAPDLEDSSWNRVAWKVSRLESTNGETYAEHADT